ncbi:MAG: hypothetical protein P4M00_10690 [Azospirillaceae bacterium]|nr:hypothetical protein [Azospirillaceae bacterium]
MDRLHAALHRLTAALDRFETALGHYETRIEVERRSLEQVVGVAQAGEAQAKGVVEAVSARLDDAIGRLQTVLEE